MAKLLDKIILESDFPVAFEPLITKKSPFLILRLIFCIDFFF